jgi:hypothetical protein
MYISSPSAYFRPVRGALVHIFWSTHIGPKPFSLPPPLPSFPKKPPPYAYFFLPQITRNMFAFSLCSSFLRIVYLVCVFSFHLSCLILFLSHSPPLFLILHLFHPKDNEMQEHPPAQKVIGGFVPTLPTIILSH